MSATVFQAPKPSPATPPSQKSAAEASGSMGILVLLAGGALWLFAASCMALIDSLKFHAPRLLADESYLSYGRLHAAQNTAFLYGFGVSAALGVGLWILCRLGRATLAGSWVVAIAAMFWHCTVFCGVIAILWGGNTGYQALEVPIWCVRLLGAAYLILGICALLTFHQRKTEQLYPSQWFVVGSLFWFPWIFSTAALALLVMPERGVLQASVQWWYAHNFDTVFLSFAGLAASFYFIPKLLGRPLRSHYQAAFAFWTLALFGSCGGIPNGAPFPSWIISLSVVGTVLTAVPILAVAGNFYQTARNDIGALDADPTLRFVYVGLIFWIIAGAQQIVGALPTVSALTDFTWFAPAQKELFHYGFFALTVFGALYYIIPGLLGMERSAWCPKLLKYHFICSFFGVMFSYISLLVTGIGQGVLLANPNNSFVDVMRRTMFPLRMSALGDLFVAAGVAIFLINLSGVLAKFASRFCPKRKEAA